MGIFEPSRAIGYITSSVPFSVQRLGTETFVTVSVGKAWQIYNCAKLNLVLVGPLMPKKRRYALLLPIGTTRLLLMAMTLQFLSVRIRCVIEDTFWYENLRSYLQNACFWEYLKLLGCFFYSVTIEPIESLNYLGEKFFSANGYYVVLARHIRVIQCDFGRFKFGERKM
ncbi:uncharacterized protein LOC131332664 [Rhododendron vialii]|uniref:uncharacterized protein LOC131332664 n=1 Tax=Rhododendron vialii TaxID=182163 RepID=UPI00265DEA92|nr:uncharacterized protein LOC131332664 [Rhododendron vialii]